MTTAWDARPHGRVVRALRTGATGSGAAVSLGITSIHLDGTETIDTVHARRPPTVPVDAPLLL